jgi:hypothetical protein
MTPKNISAKLLNKMLALFYPVSELWFIQSFRWILHYSNNCLAKGQFILVFLC